ncbi:phosphate ABC transporter substrate-binding protein [Rheinheimera sp.]|uniref:phosphate ABC transporter substrate-binding protein n=1 Tax=Rheinheimera sp. TaxID=1869214 RepID=UPI0027B93504|nr:phosphate ABC transporter substrate-binding protein [Rheinheimera sp.]
MQKKFLWLMLLFPLTTTPALADIALIVHPDNAAAVTDSDIKALFLGKQRSFSDGKQAIPLVVVESESSRSEFNTKVLSKTDSQLKAYWSKLTFTGKGTPPREVSTEEMLQLVSANPATIGFVDASKVSAAVKVVATY